MKQGYAHRTHRAKPKPTGKKKTLNFKQQRLKRIKEEENWEDYYNIIGTER